jgi:microcin C transport system permease protein
MSEMTGQAAVLEAPRNKYLSPLSQRRLDNFRANRRGWWSLWIFLALFVATLGSEFLANDKPILASYKGELLFPAFVDYPESKFGGFLAVTNYRDEFNAAEIADNGWMIWPPVRFSYQTVDNFLPYSGAVAPSWMMDQAQNCAGYPLQAADPNCHWGNFHWLGTDASGRDVLARLLYGFRISILFGLTLTVISSVIGVFAGAVQGYFGGWVDLIFQRVIEIWTSIPALYLLLIISSVITPNFWVLLGILLLFSWVSLVGIVRAEFLRGRNFEYIAAARALGVSNFTIMLRHLLPNAMVATLTFMPFILSGSVVTLTSLDLLGFGLPPGSPSLGELLAQGKNNLEAPWLGLTGFFTIAIMMTLLVFIGEAVRDAFDPRKSLA